MARVAYSFWGLLEKPEQAHNTATTAFAAVGERHLLVDEFLKNGHKVFCVQEMRESTPYPGVQYKPYVVPDVDVAYLEWRWQQHAQLSAERRNEPDWDRQVELLDEYSRRGTPIIVFDTDHKITSEDEARWPSMIIAEPSLDPQPLTKTRIRLPWATDFKPYYQTPEYSYNYIYLGNNYERDNQFQKYYGSPALELRRLGIQTVSYGNWIERSPSREDPLSILQNHPFVAFPGRMSYNAGMLAMSKSICTTMLAKKSYYRSGFITSRIYEGILAGIPSLVPREHKHIIEMGLDEFVVDSSEDVTVAVKKLFDMSKESRASIVLAQADALRRLADFSPKFKVDTIVSYAK